MAIDAITTETAPPAQRSPTASRARFARACAVGAVPALGLFLWMITIGHADLTRTEALGRFFDAQARSLFHGHWDVPGRAVFIEGIHVRGHYYMYFGPWPAVLRMPVLLLTSRFDGRLTQISMLLAFVVAIVFACRLHWQIRDIVRGHAPIGRVEWWTIAAFTFCLGGGSTLLFLASRAWVYHEAALWGVAGAIAAYDCLLAFLRGRVDREHDARSGRMVVAAGCFAAIAVLSRPAVGAGPVVALGLVSVVLICARTRVTWARSLSGRLGVRRDLVTWWRATVAAAAVPAVLYVAVNFVKFHTLLRVPFDKQVLSGYDAQQKAALRATGGTLFSARYIPSTLLQYLRPNALRPSRLFPFVAFPRHIADLFHAPFDRIDASSSIAASMPGLVVLAVIGGVAIFRLGARADGLASLRIPVLASAAGVVPTLAIGYIANRYLADFIPLLFIPAFVGLHLLVARVRRTGTRGIRIGAAAVAGLVLLGVWVNFGLALLYQREVAAADAAATRSLIGVQNTVARRLHLPARHVVRIPLGGQLPAPHQYNLAIVGDCDSLYVANATGRWVHLTGDARAGTYHLRVRLARSAKIGVRQPLLVRGSGDQTTIVTLRRISRDSVIFELRGPRDKRYRSGVAVQMKQGTWHDVDVSIDPYLSRVIVWFDAASVIDTPRIVGDGVTSVGTNVVSARLGTATRFEGTIESRHASRSYCRQFE